MRIRTEHPAIARKIVVQLQRFGIEGKTFDLDRNRPQSRDEKLHTAKLHFRSRTRNKRTYDLELLLDGRFAQLLEELAFVTTGLGIVPGISERIVHKTCCKKAYLRGAFLAGGYMSDPQKDHHFEIAAPDHSLAFDLVSLLQDLGVKAKVASKSSVSLVYVKASEDLLRTLAAMGAYDAYLKFENIRMFRELKNTANRQVNCDTYNLNRSAAAAVNQIAAIEKVLSAGTEKSLSPALVEIAELRLDNPQASLTELAALARPPLSKTAVQHRLERIIQLASAIGK